MCHAFLFFSCYTYSVHSEFAFFDFEEPLIFFFADYLAIMVLFMLVGYGLNRGMTAKRRAKIPS